MVVAGDYVYAYGLHGLFIVDISVPTAPQVVAYTAYTQYYDYGSYWENAFVDIVAAAPPEGEVFVGWAGDTRITSYNVCYTKLLRFKRK